MNKSLMNRAAFDDDKKTMQVKISGIRSCLLFAGLLMVTCTARSQQPLADTVAHAADRFIQTLDAEGKKACLFSFSDPDRRNWSNEPENMHPRKGLKLADMTAEQKKLLHRLLQTVLSEQGYLKVINVIRLDEWLKKNFYKEPAAQYYGEGLYRLAFFGTPGQDKGWGWRFEGHHLSINITMAQDKISATPFFLGTHPGIMPEGVLAGMENLFAETRLARQLAGSLSRQQQTAAMAGKPESKITDILIRTGKEPELKNNTGLAASELDAGQKQILSALINSYVNNLTPMLANYYQNILKKETWKNLHLIWKGNLQPGEPVYYRLQTRDGFVLEYCSRMHDANHIHTLWQYIPENFGGTSSP